MPQAIGLATGLLPGKFPLTLASLPLKFGSQFNEFVNEFSEKR
jgi:hypothetical protein